MKVLNSFCGFTVAGYATGFWAENALTDIFSDISFCDILENGQYALEGRSYNCDLGCWNDVDADCNRCSSIHFEPIYMRIPRGLVVIAD